MTTKMGALPSQKYDFILKSFVEYLKYEYTTVGYHRDFVNDMWIKSFLEAVDKGEWEL